jgi:hypothetical protein
MAIISLDTRGELLIFGTVHTVHDMYLLYVDHRSDIQKSDNMGLYIQYSMQIYTVSQTGRFHELDNMNIEYLPFSLGTLSETTFLLLRASLNTSLNLICHGPS